MPSPNSNSFYVYVDPVYQNQPQVQQPSFQFRPRRQPLRDITNMTTNISGNMTTNINGNGNRNRNRN